MTTSLPPQSGTGRHAAGLGVGAPSPFVGPMATGLVAGADGRHHRASGIVAMQRVETGAHPAAPAEGDLPAPRTADLTAPAAPEGAVPAPAPPSEPIGRAPSLPYPVAPRLVPAYGPPPARGVADSGYGYGSPIGTPLPAMPPEPPPGPRRDGLIVAAVVAGVLALIVGILWIAGLGGGAASTVPASAPAGAAAAAGATTSVRYEITGSGTGMVTYTDGRGAMGQEAAAPLPWSKDFTTGEYFNVFTLGVTSTDGGPVGCRILKDGAVVSEQQANGRLATATCSGH